MSIGLLGDDVDGLTKALRYVKKNTPLKGYF